MTHASLFSGIGGAEIAACMIGWENLFHCEINPFCRKILEYWFPNSTSYEDITKTNFTQWRGKIDVLTGGFPCQPFSHAGERRGADDDRYLWPQMLRAIQEIRPTWVIGENVIGITTMVEQGETVEMGSQASLFGEEDNLRSYELRERYTIERVCSDLEGIGYEVQPMVIPACAVGAPHRRDRVFILAKDTMCMGLQDRIAERQHSSLLGNSRSTSANGQVRSHQIRIAKTNGGGQIYDYTDRERWYESQLQVRLLAEPSEGEESGSKQSCRAARPYMFDRWRRFPIESPIYRGNDGIPFDVDNITIPFQEWRKESLQAYGNAIVPQVMYEIFRSIEQVTQEQQ